MQILIGACVRSARIGGVAGWILSVALATSSLTPLSGFADDLRLPPGPRRSAEPRQETAPAERPKGEEAARHPLDEVIEFAQASREALAEIKDYTAVFTKNEQVGGRFIKQSMDMKFRQKPFSVYFRFRSGPEAGREVIYVDGANGNTLVVHETGIKAIAGTMNLRPSDPKVREENRHPITDVGMAKLLEKAFKIWEAEKVSPAENVDVKFFPNAKLGKSECQAVQITHKMQRPGLEYHLSRVYFDKQTKLPIRAERYGWPRRAGEKPPLLEEYTYSNITTNVGLGPRDFDRNNPEYQYP